MKKRCYSMICCLLVVLLLCVGCTTEKQPTSWKSCTVRVMDWSAGTLFYEYHSNGSFLFYTTPNLVSYEAFMEKRIELSPKMDRTLSNAEFSGLCEAIDRIYSDGVFADLEAPENLQSLISSFSCGAEVTIAIDGAQVEFPTGAFPAYPAQKYEDFLTFIMTGIDQ